MSQHLLWDEILLEAARTRGIDLSAVDLSNPTEQHASEVSSWVNRNLQQQDLLTKEELIIWHYIERKGKQQGTDTQNEIALTSYREGELQDLTNDLDSSTQHLQLRLQLLEAQLQHFKEIEVKHEEPRKNDLAFSTPLERQHDKEIQHILFLRQEASSALDERLRVAQERLDRSLKGLSATLKARLKAEDQILGALDSSLLSDSPDSSNKTLKDQPMLDMLHRLTIQALKTRLDRIYLQNLSTEGFQSGAIVGIAELNQAQANLQSLYAEIEDVASMLTDNQHGRKLTAMNQELTLAENDKRTQSASQIMNALEAMTNSANELATQYELLQAYRTTLGKIDDYSFQTRASKDTTDSSPMKQDTQIQDHRTLALLRHFNIDDTSIASENEIITQLTTRSALLAASSRENIVRILNDSQAYVDNNRGRLERLFAGSSHDLFDAVEQSQEVDTRIASSKARLETAANATVASTNIHERLAGRYLDSSLRS